MRKKAARAVKTPIDDALDAKQKLAAERKAEDTNLWETWKQNPNQETLSPLMRRFAPVVRSKLTQYKAPNVDSAAMEANLKLHVLNAFETYNPAKAALRTHVENHLRKSQRFNAQYQNYAYIPEWQSQYIGLIDQAKDELSDELGKAPTNTQVAQFINSRQDMLGSKKPLTAKVVGTIQGNRRKDIVGSSMESDAGPYAATRNEAVLGLLRPALKPQARPVFDHIYGFNGAPQVNSTGALAKKLNMSPSQVARLKSHIATQYKKYL